MRRRAFRPKGPEFSQRESKEVKEIKEQYLDEIQDDRAKVDGFNFAFDALLSGGITTKRQLDALVNPRFSADDLVDERNGYVDIYKQTGGAYYKKRDIEGKRLEGEQIAPLLDFIQQRNEVVQAKAEAQATSQGFDFTLGVVLRGGITTKKQLDALVNPQFKVDDLVDERGGFVDIYKTGGGAYYRKADLENLKIQEGQVELLRKIVDERASAKQEKREIETAIKGFDFALLRVLDGGIKDARQLEALADPKFRGDDLIDSRGSFVDIFRPRGSSYYKKSDIKGGKIDPDDFELLTRLFKAVRTSGFPDEVKNNLVGFVQSGDLTVLERLGTILNESGDQRMAGEVQGIVRDLTERQRIALLKRDVYNAIDAGEANEVIGARIAQFEGKERENLALIAELRGVVAAKRKREIAARVASLIAPNGRDLDRALEEVTPLLRSSREDDRELGLDLVRTAYEVEIADYRERVMGMLDRNVDPELVRIYIDGLPLRPSIEGFDYVQEVVGLRERSFKTIDRIIDARRIERATEIREMFPSGEPRAILQAIVEYPENTEREKAIKEQLLELFKVYVAANRPDVFDDEFAQEIRAQQQEKFEAKFVSPEKGLNREALGFLRARFLESIFPLVESLRVDRSTEMVVGEFLDSTPERKSLRSQFTQRLRALEQQRELTETERAYLQSVELLSVFNPYLVAATYADSGVTSEFLRHHFEKTSERTLANLKDGDYVPLLQIGLGPNGLASVGEVVRNNPELASAMLVIDAGKQPGGPFAIPEGPAWELNSANRRGGSGRVLPDAPGAEELSSVRAYGSPLRWYPGERGQGLSVRQGSINVTVDYLITPDDLSTARYPTNEELQIVLSLQAAMLTKKVALETRFISMRDNPDPEAQGDKLVTLEIKDGSGTRRMEIATDAVFGATGLGEAGYGFRLDGSKAEKVINETEGKKGFPKISRTLEAFNALAGRTKERYSPGGTMVLWGRGNSADTLIEYVASIFQGDNPKVRDVTKVYILANGDLSARPRYALINDLKPRNGRGNLIELVNARVADVDFSDEQGDPQDRKIVLLDASGEAIRNSEGDVIEADSGIAATGFRSRLDSEFESYAEARSEDPGESLRAPLKLPTNDGITVAETLSTDPSVLILGTASKPEFDSVDKLAQLPVEAREALLRNGAENAVAIGFRAPDTQAAVNIWLNSREIDIDEEPAANPREVLSVDEGERAASGESVWLNRVVETEDLFQPNNIEDVVRLLSPLFIYNIGNALELTREGERRFTGEIDFSMTLDESGENLGLMLNPGSRSVPQEVFDRVKAACTDKDFQRYALIALRKKRRNPKLDIVLGFKNGYVDPKTTFVQS